MLRPAAIGLLCPLLLTGCSGFWNFLDDTHNPAPHMTRWMGNSENERQVEGKDTPIAPLKDDSGDVWPGPPPPTLTLEDIAKQPLQPVPPLEPGTPTPQNSTVPELQVPQVPHHLQPRPETNILNQPMTPEGPLPPPAPAPAPKDGNGNVVIPNGNGTSTVIAPDGTITTIPTPPPH